ncbi:MAG: hypothetical protein M1816_006673 [Peltula sp. TS41687]|nr:MAG: hypothetical protein M1816_006673 [Peltula sp. TS41687]
MSSLILLLALNLLVMLPSTIPMAPIRLALAPQDCPNPPAYRPRDRASRGGRGPQGLKLMKVLEGCGSVDYTCDGNGFVEVAKRTATLYDVGSTVAMNELEALETQADAQYIGLPAYGTLKETAIRGPDGAATTQATFSLRDGRSFFTGYEVGSFSAGADMPWGTYGPTYNWAPRKEYTPPEMTILRVKTVGGDKPGPGGCRSWMVRDSFCAQFWVYGRLEGSMLAGSGGRGKIIC